jgi:DNA-binding MarR family transcriptional regulator
MSRDKNMQASHPRIQSRTPLHKFHAAVMRQVIGDLSATIQQHDLTPAQLSTLFRLRGQGALGVSAIASQLGLSSGTTSHLVERLVQRELVVRTEHPSDRRGREISLAPNGHDFLEAFDAELNAALGRLMRDVPTALMERLTALLSEILPYL